MLELSLSGKRTERRVVESRARFAGRIVAVLDERDLRDFSRIATKLFTAFGDPNQGAREEQIVLGGAQQRRSRIGKTPTPFTAAPGNARRRSC
ncbi:MAG TPA: hypothetical protein VHV51_16540 [Polyangiaceae bacterium]|nr:hypothetical protein [Polyangiaceae bacterium]